MNTRKSAPVAVAFEGVTVIPLTDTRRLEGQTVLVAGDRIAWMGDSTAARIPTTALRVNGRSKYLIPGLTDMHSHPGSYRDLLCLLAYGVTTIRSMRGAPRHLLWRSRIASGELLGPTIHTSGPTIDGNPTMSTGMVSVEDADEAERAVARHVQAGYDSIKIHDHLSRAAYDGLIQAARARGVPLVGHVPFRVGLLNALAAGQRSIEHHNGFIEELQPRGSPLRELTVRPADARKMLAEGAILTIDADRIPDLVEAMRVAGAWSCPTLTVGRRHLQTIDELVARPEVRYLPPMYVEEMRQWKLTYPYDIALKPRELEVHYRIARELHEAGVGLLVGTDALVHFVCSGASVHDELQELVAAGITPLDALTVASRNAAQFLGEAEEWGTVSVGKRADLLLLSSDPTADIRNTLMIDGVMTRGEWHPRAELDSVLDQVAEAAKEPRLWLHDEASWPRGHDSEFAARFEMEWWGLPIGAEEVRVERGTGGRMIRSRSEVETFMGQWKLGWEAGRYENDIETNPAGLTRRVRYTSETQDGPEWGLLERGDDGLDLEREEPGLGHVRERLDAGADVLFGRTSIALYVQIATLVRDLAVAETRRLDVLAPGVPPDFGVLPTTYDITRLEDGGHQRRFRFSALRRNATYGGVIVCDPDGWPVEIAFMHRNMQLPNESGVADSPDSTSIYVRRV